MLKCPRILVGSKAMLQLKYVLSLILLSLLIALCNGGNFNQEILDIHNAFRNVHASPPLSLDNALTKKAEGLAKAAASDGNFRKPKSGENTFMLCTSYNRALTAREAVEAWYGEICNPSFSFDNPNRHDTHAFTQAIWKESTKLGIGRSEKKDKDNKCNFVVALYSPPGNLEIQGVKDKDEAFKENILKGQFNDSYCDKFKASKRNHTPHIHKRSVTKGNGNERKVGERPLLVDRRSLYYRFPARFLIDPVTGQTKAVTAGQGASNPFVKSQLGVAPQYQRSMYTGVPYHAPVGASVADVYDRNPMYSQVLGAQNAAAYSGMDGSQYYSQDSKMLEKGGTAAEMNSLNGMTSSGVLPHNTKASDKKDKNMTSVADASKRDGEVDIKAMREIAANLHNSLRKIHGVGPLTLSDDLNAAAQKQAEDNAEKQKMEHAKGLTEQGENLAYNCPGPKTIAPIEESIKEWYNEVCTSNYDFSRDGGQGALHFTQVVWGESTELGCGRATAEQDFRGYKLTCTYFCCRYRKRGNMMGDFTKYVKKGSFNSESTCKSLDNIVKDSANPGAPGGGTNQTTNEDNESDKDNGKNPTPDTNKETGQNPTPGKDNGQNSSPDKDKENGQNEGKKPKDANDAEKSLKDDAISAHNSLRQIHGTPPLELDDDLNKEAELWAKELAKKGGLEHSEAKDYGENLAYRCSWGNSVASVKDSIADWYKEACDDKYDFNLDMQSGTLHFTQVVWKETIKLGIGMATSKKDNMLCTYFVGQYKPKGNMIGDFKKNVPKGNFDPDKTCSDIDGLVNAKTPESENGVRPTGTNNTGTSEDNITDNTPIKQKPVDSNETLQETDKDTPTKEKPKDGNETQQDKDEKNYEDDAIKVMNKFREIHGAPPLSADDNLHQKAKSRADSFVTGLIKRDQRKSQLGENVQVACNVIDKVLPPEEAIANWYREVCGKNYDFEKEESQNASHFTQMVWKSSEKVSVAYSTKKKKNKALCTVIVAEYDPVGNEPSKFTGNVQKGEYDKSFCGSINTIASNALEDDSSTDNGQTELKGSEEGDNPQEEVFIPTNKTGKPNTSDEQNDSNEEESQLSEEKKPDEQNPNQGLEDQQDSENKTNVKSTGDPSVDPEFINEGLTAHNALRSIHESVKMIENSDLSVKAQEWANTIAEASKSGSEDTQKKSGLDYGQNVVEQCFDEDKKVKAEDAVSQWWAKGFCEDGRDAISSKKLSPATQVVWNSSIELGMAQASFEKDSKYCSVVVAMYSPKGNVEEEFDENVVEGNFDYNNMCDNITNTLEAAKELSAKDIPTIDSNKDTENTVDTGKANTDDSSENKDQSGFLTEGLEAHNVVRKTHDAPLMKLSAKMSEEAEEYAKQLVTLETLKHSSVSERDNDGENLYYVCSSVDKPISGSAPVEAWYEEACKPDLYNFNSTVFDGGTGHFTQVVWKGSTLLGMGVAKGTKNGMTCYYVVGRYRPAGNIGGALTENVLKGSFTQETCDNLNKNLKSDSKRGSIEHASGDALNNSREAIPTKGIKKGNIHKGGKSAVRQRKHLLLRKH